MTRTIAMSIFALRKAYGFGAVGYTLWDVPPEDDDLVMALYETPLLDAYAATKLSESSGPTDDQREAMQNLTNKSQELGMY